jgi:hypothetical protein
LLEEREQRRRESGNSGGRVPCVLCLCCLLSHPLLQPPIQNNQQWDKVENKTGVLLYGAGAVVLLWLSNAIVGAIDAVPLVRRGVVFVPRAVVVLRVDDTSSACTHWWSGLQRLAGKGVKVSRWRDSTQLHTRRSPPPTNIKHRCPS